MIKLKFLKYEENYDLDIKITQLINKNLYELFDIANGIDDNFDILPEVSIIPNGCYRKLDFDVKFKLLEIKQIFISNVLRDYISPVNEYIIYQYINILSELQDEDSDFKLDISDELLQEIDNCQEYYSEYENDDGTEITFNIVRENIFDFDNYREFLFYDWDFDNFAVNNITQIYLRGLEEKTITQTLHYNNLLPFIERLQEFEELMDDDIYYQYMEVKTMKSKEEKNDITNTTYIGTQNILNDNSKIDNQINENSNSEEKRKSFAEKHGLIAAIIAAIVTIVCTIVTILFN